jgi:RLL motif-containing protein 1
MFKRKLSALDYGKDYNPQDENQFRQMVVWLEDMKIRLYPIDARQTLRDIQNPQWEQALFKYLQDLKFPYDNEMIKDRLAVSDWLIGAAVRFEYGDNVGKYKSVLSNATNDQQKTNSSNQTGNPLETIDFSSEEFKSGMLKLCELLQIPTKFNDTAAILRAVSKVITTKLSKEAIEKSQIKEQGSGVDFSIEQMPLGFDTGDKIINEAAKVLRLLYIQDLRTLQTKINETIVSVQSLVADPRTDSKLGKIGY